MKTVTILRFYFFILNLIHNYSLFIFLIKKQNRNIVVVCIPKTADFAPLTAHSAVGAPSRGERGGYS